MKRARSTTSGKMVHYTVPTPDDGVTMTFYVAVRPCITYLVSRHPELFDPKSGGTTTILLASANDDERTEAVLEYLTYEGKTLSELSPLARYIPRSEFLDNYEVSRSGCVYVWVSEYGIFENLNKKRNVFQTFRSNVCSIG